MTGAQIDYCISRLQDIKEGGDPAYMRKKKFERIRDTIQDLISQVEEELQDDEDEIARSGWEQVENDRIKRSVVDGRTNNERKG